VIKSKVHVPGGLANGNVHHDVIKSEDASRHTSPEANRSAQAGPSKLEEIQTAEQQRQIAMASESEPFPWEPSIAFNKPIDIVGKSLGDFLFFNVVDHGNLAEIQARGVQFEIEAKLGTLISRETNDRLDFPLQGECVLLPGSKMAFKSSMTEVCYSVSLSFAGRC
jgi:hypothetical protein